MNNRILLFIFVLLTVSVSLDAQIINSAKPKPNNNLDIFKTVEPEYLLVQKELNELEKKKTELLAMMKDFDEKQKTVAARIKKVESKYDSVANLHSNPLLHATKMMQETQMSFNLQYLQLQSQMQHENRSYTAISTIMKTKHDTVKNSISNVR